jgi:Protein of unknown function (DUF2809)
MIRPRIAYFILIFITIAFGLLSRDFKTIPLFTGDILWALMVYFIMRFLFVKKLIKVSIIASLLFCYAIEFGQLYKAPWINNIRHTPFGRLVLGDTSLWGDLLCYTAGIGIGVLVDRWIFKQK